MGAGRKDNVTAEAFALRNLAEGGMILMDLFFQPIAIDQGATSILAAMSLDQRGQGTSEQDPALALTRNLGDLMRCAEAVGPETMKMSFHVGDFAYTGCIHVVEPHNGAREALMVLHLKRDDSAYHPLAQVGAYYNLTERELETLKGIALGLTNKELAQRMNISPNTVKTFLRLVMVKMGVTRRTGIVAKLLENLDMKPCQTSRTH